MTTRDETIEITVDDDRIAGTLLAPASVLPGVLFVHGWRGDQTQYLARAREIAALGCICLTFSLRGHAETEHKCQSITREDSLHDVIAAYDVLAGVRGVDKSAIAVIGSSYGGYMAALLTTHRPVRWLGLRVPALYQDEDWRVPKQQLDRDKLAAYRRGKVRPDDNAALRACKTFSGDVLIVQCEHDDVVPPPVIANYRAACADARSLTFRMIDGADHGLSRPEWQQAYTSILVNWATEMVVGARQGAAAATSDTLPPLRRGPPRPA